LFLVAEEQHAAIVSRYTLDFSNDGIDDGSFVRIRSAVKTVCFVDDKYFTLCGIENALCVSFRGAQNATNEVGGRLQDNCKQSVRALFPYGRC
jgi:hypothetical protein